MNELTVACPTCHAEIALNEALTARLIDSKRQELELRINEKEAAVAQRENTLRQQQAKLVQSQESMDKQIATTLRSERAKIAEKQAHKARLALSHDLDQKGRELADLQQVLTDRNMKLAEAQQGQAVLIRKQRELDDAKRELEVVVEQRVQESLTTIRDQAKLAAEEGLRFKLAEKEETIAAMQRQIEEVKRRSEQGSQQLQGEVLELELESLLRVKFPTDTIERVPKGVTGGDILHRIIGPMGLPRGTILWESKRTKNWHDGWLPKLREDQRRARADLAVLVSQTLPKDIATFDQIDGVWITKPSFTIPLGIALRHSLIEIAAVRAAGAGQLTKMEMTYQYLTGPRFRQRIETIVEKFADMQEDLNRERKTMTRVWAKREGQIQGVIESTAGLYGDLQGIAGRAMMEIESLEFKALPEGAAAPETA